MGLKSEAIAIIDGVEIYETENMGDVLESEYGGEKKRGHYHKHRGKPRDYKWKVSHSLPQKFPQSVRDNDKRYKNQ